METIQAFLVSHGISVSDIVLDGTLKELKTDKFKGWYVGDDLGEGKRTLTIEDWRTRDRYTFTEGIDLNNPEEKAKLEESRAKYEQEKIALQEMKQQFCERDLKKFTKLATEWNKYSKYLTDKKINPAFGALQIQSNVEVTDLIIPMQDIDGKIWNYQTIQDSGFKSFVPGALVDGLFYELKTSNEKQDQNLILITEGYATACSVQLAMPYARVVAAFSANNLEAVAISLRAKNLGAKIIVCGDDDWKTEPNAGADKARSAAMKAGAQAVLPIFATTRGKTWTDWNDLHCGYSLNVVTTQLEKACAESKPPSSDWTKSFLLALTQEKLDTKIAAEAHKAHVKRTGSLNAIDPYVNGVAPMQIGVSKAGKPILPDEFVVATELYKYYEGRIVVSENSVFIFDKTHWKEVDEYNKAKIILQIQVLYGGSATNSRLNATYEQFARLLPKAGRNLFEPNPYISNFANGTLHIEKREGKWRFRFTAHAQADFCTHVIPIDYDETRKIRNLEFEAMIHRVCGEDKDGEEKVKAIRQMYGACIAPVFPHLFMLHGPAKSGKTSIILPAGRLVHADNWSSVEPHEFKGFTMESMVGKLVNIVTDINLNEPIDDNHIKKIEDRIPMRIDRKFKNSIKAPLPAIHIFGGNDIPPTFEKGSGAHERRWTFIHIQGLKVQGNYSKSFANDVFDACPQGILNFALDGLLEVLDANGHFYVPESGRRKMEQWQTAHDPVAQFIKEIGDGEVAEIRFQKGAKMKRSSVWPVFVSWYERSFNRKPRIGKIKFFEALLLVQSSPLPLGVSLYEGVRYVLELCGTGNVDSAGHEGSDN